MSEAIQDIMNFVGEKLEPAGLDFALVVWKPGLPGGEQSIGVAYHPKLSKDAPTALALAAVRAETLNRQTAEAS